MGQPSWAAVFAAATAVGAPQSEYAVGPSAATGVTVAASRRATVPAIDAATRQRRGGGEPRWGDADRVIVPLHLYDAGARRAPLIRGRGWRQARAWRIGTVLRQ